jgi:tRNA G18 (ribose-2'-O)-methylase SpoU
VIEPVEVCDINDPRVEVFRDVRDRDLRGRQGIFMAESEMVVQRLLRTPERLHSLLLSPAKYVRLAPDLKDLSVDCPVYVADLKIMESIAGFHIHRGVLAAGWRPIEQDLVFDRLLDRLPADGPCTVLAASGINNSDNIGGLFRTAAALGVEEMLLDGRCCDPLYRKAIRVSMGHVLSVPWVVEGDLPGALRRLQEFGFRITAAESGPRSCGLGDQPKGGRRVVVVGAEGHGLDEDVLDVCDEIVEIPMSRGVPSLNVVVAAGIVLAAVREEAC